jgi:hypothetical protein
LSTPPAHICVSELPCLEVICYAAVNKTVVHKIRRTYARPQCFSAQEAEIRRTEVQSQPEQIVCETLSGKKPITKKGWWSDSRCRPCVQTPVQQKKKKKKMNL